MSEEESSNFFHPPVADVSNDDSAINYAQEIRKGIVQGFVRGAGMTKDPEELKIVLAAVNGMANTAIGNKRIKAEEKGAAGNAELAGAIAEMLNKAQRSTLFQVESDREPPTLDEQEHPDPVTVTGETEINPAQLSYDNFMTPKK